MEQNFNPNSPSDGRSIFGLPYTQEQANIIILPVPWDATASYHKGTSEGPNQIFNASHQVDVLDPDFKNAWENRIFQEPTPSFISSLNDKTRNLTALHQQSISNQKVLEQKELLASINACSLELNDWVYTKSLQHLETQKSVIVLGGEHSTPYGLV
jgi:agmatinase